MTCSGARRSARSEYRAANQGACRGRHRPPAAPDTLPDRSVLTFESDAGERGLQEPRVPIAGFDHERHCHAAKHGELVDDRPRRGWLSGLGLGRHASCGCNAGAMGQTAVYIAFRGIASHPRRNSVQDARKRMIVTVSSGAGREAAWTPPALDLETIAQRPLALHAAGLTDLLVMAPAGSGRFLLGVAGAAVPDTFPERHAGSFRRARAISASASARRVPVSRARSVARLQLGRRRQREDACRVLPPSAVRRRAR